MPYDLYGQYYASRRDAANAEMAQMALIDADLAQQKIAELEQRLTNSQMSQDYNLEMRLAHMEARIESLEKRLQYNNTKPDKDGR